jgi:hypothetical protein
MFAVGNDGKLRLLYLGHLISSDIMAVFIGQKAVIFSL